MAVNKLGVHEALELHEIISFKSLCATKASTMSGLVSDPQLKAMLSQDVKLSKKHISDLQGLIQNTGF